jgi:hypothetical protein
MSRAIGRWHVRVLDRFNSEAFVLNERITEFRDENRSEWRLSRSLRPWLDVVTSGEALWFRQNQSTSQEWYGGLRVSPRSNFWLEPQVGYAWDRKPGPLTESGEEFTRLDAGPAASIDMGLARTQAGDFFLSGEASGRWQFISPREGRAFSAHGVALRPGRMGKLQMDARFVNLRRDSYRATSFLNRDVSANSESIEATRSDTLSTNVHYERQIGRSVSLRTASTFTANNRFIRTLDAPDDAIFFDTNYNRRLAEFRADLEFDDSRTNGRLAIVRTITVERRKLDNQSDLPPSQATQKSAILKQADFDRGVLALRASIVTRLLRRLDVSARGSASILRHDTPDANLDDRGEAFYDAGVGLRYRVSTQLTARIDLFGMLHHTVFLNGARSAENNRRRSLRLRPEMQWTPGHKTDLRFNTEVRAVYTVDDFSIEGRPRNDQSARELKYGGQLEQQLTPTIAFRGDGSYSKLYLGRLLWDRFAEAPFDTLTTTTGWVRLVVGTDMTAEIGMRSFTRSDFERSLSIQVPVDQERSEVITRPGRQRIWQFGPTAAVSWPMSRQSQLRLDGWIQIQHTRRKLYGQVPPATLDRIREAGSDVSRRMIPNLAVEVVWRF